MTLTPSGRACSVRQRPSRCPPDIIPDPLRSSAESARASTIRNTICKATDAEARAQSDQHVFLGGAIMVGSPRRLVEQLIDLHHQGIDGGHMVLLDFDDLDFFGTHVMPLLHAAGRR